LVVQFDDVHTEKGSFVVVSATCDAEKGPAIAPVWQSPPDLQVWPTEDTAASNKTAKVQILAHIRYFPALIRSDCLRGKGSAQGEKQASVLLAQPSLGSEKTHCVPAMASPTS
jgi:hypothetical protein